MRRSANRLARQTCADEPIMDINATPLIDVMLVLLIMLIVTVPVQLHSVKLNMPSVQTPRTEVPPVAIRIDIDLRSQVLWNGEPTIDNADLESRLQAAAEQPNQPEIHVRPDRKAKYEVVAHVLASVQRLRLKKLGVLGMEQFRP